MARVAAAHQPNYLPWPGTFHKMHVADAWIVLDDVQYEKRGFTNRNRVRTPDGWTWLTVPVSLSGDPADTEIRDVTIADEHRWADKHWGTLQHSYSNAPHFDDHAGFFERTYDKTWEQLAELNLHLLTYLRDALGIEVGWTLASEVDVDSTGSDRILDLCLAADADVYYSGPSGRDYMDEAAFADAGVDVVYQDFTPPTYDQVFDGFEPKLSVVDLLFNVGPESLEAITTGNADRADVVGSPAAGDSS